jgi:plastocyanin
LEQTGPKPIKVLAVGIGVLLLIVAAANLLIGSLASGSAGDGSIGGSASANQALGGTLAPVNNGVQEVAISMQGSRYQPYPIRVKAGIPVRFTVDMNTVKGCYRSIVIPELGVSGRVATGSNIIEFTPSKAGTFRMTCGMGMADGRIIVEDANGQAPAPTAQAAQLPVGGGSCGAGGGGCGCGGG